MLTDNFIFKRLPLHSSSHTFILTFALYLPLSLGWLLSSRISLHQTEEVLQGYCSNQTHLKYNFSYTKIAKFVKFGCISLHTCIFQKRIWNSELRLTYFSFTIFHEFNKKIAKKEQTKISGK